MTAQVFPLTGLQNGDITNTANTQLVIRQGLDNLAQSVEKMPGGVRGADLTITNNNINPTHGYHRLTGTAQDINTINQENYRSGGLLMLYNDTGGVVNIADIAGNNRVDSVDLINNSTSYRMPRFSWVILCAGFGTISRTESSTGGWQLISNSQLNSFGAEFGQTANQVVTTDNDGVMRGFDARNLTNLQHNNLRGFAGNALSVSNSTTSLTVTHQHHNITGSLSGEITISNIDVTAMQDRLPYTLFNATSRSLIFADSGSDSSEIDIVGAAGSMSISTGSVKVPSFTAITFIRRGSRSFLYNSSSNSAYPVTDVGDARNTVVTGDDGRILGYDGRNLTNVNLSSGIINHGVGANLNDLRSNSKFNGLFNRSHLPADIRNTGTVIGLVNRLAIDGPATGPIAGATGLLESHGHASNALEGCGVTQTYTGNGRKYFRCQNVTGNSWSDWQEVTVSNNLRRTSTTTLLIDSEARSGTSVTRTIGHRAGTNQQDATNLNFFSDYDAFYTSSPAGGFGGEFNLDIFELGERIRVYDNASGALLIQRNSNTQVTDFQASLTANETPWKLYGVKYRYTA